MGETLLCGDCLGRHVEKSPNSTHQTHPISAYSNRSSPGYLERLRIHETALLRARQLRETTTQKVDASCEQLREKVTLVINHLYEFVERKSLELQSVKFDLETEIDQAIRELEGGEAPLSNSIARFLTSHAENESLTLFEFQLGTRTYPQSLDEILTYSISLPKGDEEVAAGEEILPGISGNNLWLYDTVGAIVQQATLKQTFSAGTRFLLQSGTVLAVGGLPPSNAVFTIDLNTFTVTVELPMSVKRDGAGLARYMQRAFVFGGFGEMSAKTCEVFSEKKWRRLPDMKHERGAFTPCVHAEKIYLPDVRHPHGVLEAFLPASESFEVLRVELPRSLGNSVSFITDDTLYIVTDCEKVVKWRIGEHNCTSDSVFMEDVEICTFSCGPVQIARKVFWVTATRGEFAAYDMDMGLISITRKNRK